MSRKNLLKYQNIVNADMSAASITSSVSNIQTLDNIGLQLSWTGAPIGSFDVQVSVDYLQDAEGNVQNAGTWVSLSFVGSLLASGVADQLLISLNQVPAPFIRVVYTKTSGTGTLNGFIAGKMV